MPVPPPLSDPSGIEQRLNAWVEALEQVVADAHVTLSAIRQSLNTPEPDDEQQETDTDDRT